MDLRKLTYFITVVEEGSISGAAQRLHMTQPPLSQAVLTLERELGARLLERHARGVAPTPAGLLLVQQGRNLLQWANRISDQVARVGSGESGSIYVASMPTFAWSHLPALLREFKSKLPGVELRVADPGPSGVLTMVLNGTADVGFASTADPSALAVAYPDLIVETLIPLELSLAVASAGGAECGPIRNLTEVRKYADKTWYIPEEVPRFPGVTEITQDLWRAAGFFPDSIQSVATLQTSLPLVAAGMGVALMPGSLAGLQVTSICNRTFDPGIPTLFATTIRSRRMEPSASLLHFLDAVDEHFARLR